MRIASIVIVCALTGLIGLPTRSLAIASFDHQVAGARLPITIIAPASAQSGTLLCFDVVALGGLGSVLIEVNEVRIPFDRIPTSDPNVTQICFRVPPAGNGSTIIITATSLGGAVATALVGIQ